MDNNLMKLCIQFLLIFVSIRQSIQKESCYGNLDNIKTSVRALVKEFDFRNPIIYQSYKFIDVNVLMELNSIGQYSAFWQSEIEREYPVLLVVNVNITKELQLDIKKMERAFVILKSVEFENIMDKLQIKISQEIYFFQVSTCEVYEQYEINNIKLKQRLGYLQSNTFIWEENLRQR